MSSYKHTNTYAEHERSTYANAIGCADHNTDAECAAYTNGWADFAAEHSDDALETEYEKGYDLGYSEGHCCDHG